MERFYAWLTAEELLTGEAINVCDEWVYINVIVKCVLFLFEN